MEYPNEKFDCKPSTSTGNYPSDLSMYNHQSLKPKKKGTVKKKWNRISFKVKNFINRKFNKSFKSNAKKTKLEGISVENRSNNKNLSIYNRPYCFDMLPQNIQNDIDQIKQIYKRLLKRIENLKKFLHNPKYVKNSNINRLNALVKQYEKQEERNNEVLKSFINGIYLLWKEYKQETKGQHRKILSKINTKKNIQTTTNNQRDFKITHKTVETLPLANNKYKNFGSLSHKQININGTENLMEQSNIHIQFKAPVNAPNTNSTYQCGNIQNDNNLTVLGNTEDLFANNSYLLTISELKKEEDPITAQLVKQLDENIEIDSYNSLLDNNYRSFRSFFSESSMIFSEYEDNIQSGNCYYYKNYDMLVTDDIFSQDDWFDADLKDPSDLTHNSESECTHTCSNGMSILLHSNVSSHFADLEYSSDLQDTIKHSRDMSRKSAYSLQLKKVNSEGLISHKGLTANLANPKNKGLQIKESFDADILLPPERSSSDSNINLKVKSYPDLKPNQYLEKRTHLLPPIKTTRNHNYNISSIYTILAKNEVLSPRYNKWIASKTEKSHTDDIFKQQPLCTQGHYNKEHPTINRKLSSVQEEKISASSNLTMPPSSKNFELDSLMDLSLIEINSTRGITTKLIEPLAPKELRAESNKEIILSKTGTYIDNKDKSDCNGENLQNIRQPQTFSFKNLHELNNDICDPDFTPLLEKIGNGQKTEGQDILDNSNKDKLTNGHSHSNVENLLDIQSIKQTLKKENYSKYDQIITDQFIQTDEVQRNSTEKSSQCDKIYLQTSEKGVQIEKAAVLRGQISQTEELSDNNKSTKEQFIQTNETIGKTSEKIVQTENVALVVSEECTQTEDNRVNAKEENVQTETTIIRQEEQMVQTEEDNISVCEQSIQTEEKCTNVCNESVQTLPRMVIPIGQITQTEDTAISVGEQTQEVVKCVCEQFTLTEETCVTNCDQALQTSKDIIMTDYNAKEEKLKSKLILNDDFQVELKESIVNELESKMEENTIGTLNNGVVDFDCEDDVLGLDKLFCHNNPETIETQVRNNSFAIKDKRIKHTRPCSLILSLKYRPLLPNSFRNRRKKPPRITSNNDRQQSYSEMTERMNINENRDTFFDVENNYYEYSLIVSLPRCDEKGLQDEIVGPQQQQTFTDNKLHLQNVDGNVGNHNTETRKKHKTIKHYSRPCSIVFRLKSKSAPLNIFAHKTKMRHLKSKSTMECGTVIKNKRFLSRYVQKTKHKQARRFCSSLPSENHTSSINIWDYFTRSPCKRTYEGDYIDVVNTGFRSNMLPDTEWVRKLPKSEEHKYLEDIGDLDFQESDTNTYSTEETVIFNIPHLKSASEVSASETSDDETCTNIRFKALTLLPSSQGQIRVIQAWPENGTDVKIKTRQKKKMVEQLDPINLLMDEEYILRKKESKKFDRVLIEDLSTQVFDTVTHLKPCHIEIANNQQKTEYQQKIETYNGNTENMKKEVKFFSVQNEPRRFDDLIIEDSPTQTFHITVEGLKSHRFEIQNSIQDNDSERRDVIVHAQELDHPLKSENRLSSSMLQDDGIMWIKPLHSPDSTNYSIDNSVEKRAFLPMQRSKKYKSKDTKCSLVTKELTQYEDVSLNYITKADKDNAIINTFGSVMDLRNYDVKDSITRPSELNLPFTSPQKINRNSGLINLKNKIKLSSVSKQSSSFKKSLIPIKKSTNASSLRKITYSTHRLSSKGTYSSYSPIKLMLRKNVYMSKSCPDIYRRFKSDLKKHKVKSIMNKKTRGKLYAKSNKKLNSMNYKENLHELRKCYQAKFSGDSQSRDEDLTIEKEYARNKTHNPKNDNARETEDHEIIQTVVACVNWMNDVITDADNLSASDSNMMNNNNNDEVTSLVQHSLSEILSLPQNVNVERRYSAPVSGENGNDRETRDDKQKATPKITPAVKNF